MWGRILEIFRKEFIQMLKDPRMRVVLFGPPIVELLIYGFAVNFNIEHSRVAWMDHDNTFESRELLGHFQASRYFQVTEMPEKADQIRDLFERGKVVAAIQVLPGFGRDIHRGKTASVQVVVDGTNSNTAAIIANYSSEVIAEYGTSLAKAGTKASALANKSSAIVPTAAKFIVQSRVWFNPELNSRDYFIPGILVNILAMVTIMLTAMSIVRERELGTMEQLMVTPVKPVELMIGKLVPVGLIGLFDVFLVIGAAKIVFHTPFRGSIFILLGCTILFLLTALGVGLFISTVSRTQQQALISSCFYLLPAILLSGFAFPIRSMPPLVQIMTYFNPLRYFTEIVRNIFLKGSGVGYLWPQMLALAIIGTTTLALSIDRFGKRFE
jgi:ABC-2 type transport system permease protein